MRTLIIAVITAIAIPLTWQPADAAASSTQEARSRGECVRLANARGWTRYGEKGRLPFIKRCMRGARIG